MAAKPSLTPNTAISHGASAADTARGRSVDPGDYFAIQQPQPQHPPQQSLVDDQTLSNTLVNSQPHGSERSEESTQSAGRTGKFTEEWDTGVRGSSIAQGSAMQRSNSISSKAEVLQTRDNDDATTSGASLSRGTTLKKKASLKRNGSLKRSSSRRSMKAGSVRSLAFESSHDGGEESQNIFFCPVPTTGNPTETLANRFLAWRKILKDIITYFREIQTQYETRSKSLLKLANVLNNTNTPPGFLPSGGLNDALQMLRSYHKNAINEANKAKDIEEDVILALTGLRSDLNQKIKEIKSLSGDFKNSVEKEMENTRRAVKSLQDVLGQNELDSSLTTGKQDPYLLRLAVDRQVERQIDEENYLHQAYLNLESSGRELEAIVVGEIQKSYNAYAGILKRESDAAYSAIDELRAGPIAMPKDHEWQAFVRRDDQFIDSDIAVRSADRIHYPGRDHFAAQEIRAGLLERKSKYLKSYTAGWYVLSPTHLHEFKSADKTQAPVMSLYLPEQKLGSHSTEGGSSNKFVLKGRQTGSMHRGHTWVFRAESHDTMMAWYEDIKNLTEKSPEELSNFVRGHVRSMSRSSQRSVSTDGEMDVEDEEPFVSEADAAVVASPGSRNESVSSRPQPGGRFPSDLQVDSSRGLQVPLSPSSDSSGVVDSVEFAMRGGGGPSQAPVALHTEAPARPAPGEYETIAAAGALPGSGVGQPYSSDLASQAQPVGTSYGSSASISMEHAPSHAAIIRTEAMSDGVNPYSGEPAPFQRSAPQHPAGAPIALAASLPESAGHPGPDSYGSMNGQPLYSTEPVAGMQRNAPEPQQPLGTAYNYTQGQTAGPLGLQSAQQLGQKRPTGGRSDSTPHVPGEYPRGTPLQSPGV